MAVEPFLPSEIARLVYGYLVEEKCTETAKSFLNESPNMYECRSVLQYGRTFTTRICGMALQEILEKFCAVNCIVHNELTILEGAHKLKNCKDIVTQTKFLLEGYKSQQATSSINEPIEADINNPSSKVLKKRHSGKNENGSNVPMQSDDGYQTETPPDSNSLQNILSVEATPLENLPGYVENLQNKNTEIRPVVLKTPRKFTNQFAKNLQMEENIRSQLIENSEALGISQVTKFGRKVQVQEMPISFKIIEMDKTLIQKPVMDEIQKGSIENHEKCKADGRRLNADEAVISLEKSNCLVSKTVIPVIDLCNHLDSCSRNQEVINLDDTGDQTSLESPTDVDPEAKVSEACIEILEDVQSELLSRTEIQEKIASNINKLMEPIKSMPIQGDANDGNNLLMNDLNKIVGTAVDMTESDPLFIQLLDSIVRLDEHVSSSEEIDMDIDNENPSSEENISNEGAIIEENKKHDPKVTRVDDILVIKNPPVLQDLQFTQTVETTIEVEKFQVTVVRDPKVCKEKYLAGQPLSLTNIPKDGVNEKCLVNPIQPSLLDKNFSELSDLPDHNTSTPLKLATQNYDSNEWFTTQTLPPSIISMKDASDANGVFTATESIVNPIDGFISPIVNKENTKVAEKISLNCSNANAVKDDTLHTPDIPPVTRSFIPKLPAPMPDTITLQKDKVLVLPKNSDGENVSPNVQKVPETLSGFISISSLVKNTEFNRYFSIDSISVAHMDNTVQNRPTESEVEVEDSVGFTGTGLSPFLKLNRKTGEDRNEQSLEIEPGSLKEIADNVIEGDMETDEINGKASENSKEHFVEGKSKESSREETSIPITSQAAHKVDNELGESMEIGTTDKIVDVTRTYEGDSSKMNTCQTVESIGMNLKTNLDSTSKALEKKATEIEPKKSVKEILNIVLGEGFEKGEDALSKIHGKMNSSAKISSTTSQADTCKHPESKVQTGTGKKESLKSFLSKTFESYIDSSKDNTASNQNNEITKNTPKVLLDDRPKSQRRSLSTPKKSSSHIRALNFETPIQSRSDSKINDKARCASPETAKRNLIRLHQSFQSPTFANNELVDQVQSTAVLDCANAENVKSNVKNETMIDKASKLSHEMGVKEGNAKRSWDSDLRSLVGDPSEQPKVEIPKRKSKIKSRESSSTKNSRDESKTPRKDKKSVKSPYKKLKKGEKEKTSKSQKRENLKEHEGDKKKISDELSDKDCKDLGALIESNFLSSENDDTVDKFEIKEKVTDELSTKECKVISTQIESNLMLSKDNKAIKKVEIKTRVEETSSAENLKDVNAQSENNSLPTENEIVKTNIEVSRATSSINSKKDTVIEIKKVHDNDLINVPSDQSNGVSSTAEDQVSRQEVTWNFNSDDQKSVDATEKNSTPKEPNKVKTAMKKDPLEYLLSDSINDEDVFNDVMEIDSSDIVCKDELTRTKKQVDRETAEKMQQDEQVIAAVLEEANQAINEKFKSVDQSKQQDFFPETSLMTDGDESEEENVVQRNVTIPKTEGPKNPTEQVNERPNLQLEKENISLYKEHTKADDVADTTPKPSSKSEVDYEMIEQQLSILTDTEVSSVRKVIYDQVSKVEGGKVVKKKYARLKTLEKRSPTDGKLAPLSGYEIVLDSSTSFREEEDSMEMPPTPQITDPGSNSWLPNSGFNREDSRTILSSIPTPLECPPTPKIFITPHKVEEEVVDDVHKKPEVLPGYHLTPITFEVTKKPVVTEFEVVKETFKKTTPKTPGEKEENERKSTKTPRSVASSRRDKSVTDSDSEDSDSSSSSDSSDSSSSSSDDADDSSIHHSELAETKEVLLESHPKPETKLDVFFQNEEVVVGSEVIYIEHEEVVVATELSPAKVFSIQKTDKEIEETIKETPAKDENMIPEEGIFETPNISKPVDNPTNLHAKISQMMILKEQEEMRRLESQQKPKIINIESVSSKIVMKNGTKYPEAPATASENKEIKTNLVKKSEAEVAKAIESIASEKFDKNQDELDLSAGRIDSPEILNDKLKKRELSKAIQSITKEEKCEGISESSSDDSSSDDEPNLELVLEDDVSARRPEEVTEDESLGLDDNCDVKHAEHHFIFDEANYKKRRRKQFTDEEMSFQPQDEDGNILGNINPTSVDILLNLIPTKKKMVPKKKIKTEIKLEKEESEAFDDGDSSENFVPVKNVRNTRGSSKRRRSDEESKSRKRKKNIFIY